MYLSRGYAHSSLEKGNKCMAMRAVAGRIGNDDRMGIGLDDLIRLSC